MATICWKELEEDMSGVPAGALLSLGLCPRQMSGLSHHAQHRLCRKAPRGAPGPSAEQPPASP